jgi:hypothetical protein
MVSFQSGSTSHPLLSLDQKYSWRTGLIHGFEPYGDDSDHGFGPAGHLASDPYTRSWLPASMLFGGRSPSPITGRLQVSRLLAGRSLSLVMARASRLRDGDHHLDHGRSRL